MLGNTTKPLGSGLDAKLDDAAQTAREREKEHEATAEELWTLAVTQALVVELPRAVSLATAASDAVAAEDATEAVPDSLPPAAGSGWERAAARSAWAGAPTANTPEAAANAAGAPLGDGIPAELCTEVSDERLGKLRLVVARGAHGLDIVINVADSHVKALIEAERAVLMKTLKDAGLSVASVQIGSAVRPGTALAQDREGPGKARPHSSIRQPVARWRTYQGSQDEDDADSEGVDLTA